MNIKKALFKKAMMNFQNDEEKIKKFNYNICYKKRYHIIKK